MSNHHKPSGYRAYLLRFWEERRENSGLPRAWRFSLEDPHTGERRGFADLEGLVAFLRREMEEGRRET